MSLYFEAHVTTDPLTSTEDIEHFQTICNAYGFRPAKLLMQKGATLVPSDLDAFCTTRSSNFGDISDRVYNIVKDLKGAGIRVRRYKIEDTVMDSRNEDVMGLL